MKFFSNINYCTHAVCEISALSLLNFKKPACTYTQAHIRPVIFSKCDFSMFSNSLTTFS